MPGLADTEGPPQLLPLACRFIPYDQWLTTHVHPEWKVKEVKLWILSKCLGVSLDSTLHPWVSRTTTAPSSSSAAHHSHTPHTAPTPPGHRFRPASPITFAPDPRRRPISPILFAKGGKGKDRERKKGKAKAKAKSDDLETDPTPTQSAEGTPISSPTDGYEDDDEYDTPDEGADSFDEAELYKPSPPPPLPIVLPPPPPPALVPPPPPSGKWAKYNTAPTAYTLMRFSTGQILEDELSLAMHDLAPYELLEMHAHGGVCIMPATWATPSSSSSKSAAPQPLATVSEHGHGGTQHHRSTSLYSLALPASSSTTSTAPTAPYVYLPPLNRTLLPTYVQPYWEGPVRALRVVWREPALEVPLANFANGYGYGYGGVGSSFVDSRALGLGIGQPPPMASAQGREHGYGYGGWDARVGLGGKGGSGSGGRGRRTSLEWRTRWVVIREGVLSLCKDRDDPNPTHILPLSSLTALRGADYLSKSPYLSHNQDQGQNQPPHSPLVPHHPPSIAPSAKSKKGKEKANPPPSLHGHSRFSTSTLPAPSLSHSDSQSDTHHPGEGGARMIGEEAIDDLRIVCVKFRSADRLRKVVTGEGEGERGWGYVRGYEDKKGERERARKEGAGTGDGARDKKKKKKEKEKRKEGKEGKLKKGKGLLPWERDDKEKEKEKERGKDKEKEKDNRAWITAFGVKKDREPKPKHKDKSKHRDHGGVVLGGMGMGMGLGLGLSVGVQDAKERFMQERKQELLERERREEQERERERAALSEADAEASITFARRSGEGMTSSSEEDDAKVEAVRERLPGLGRDREREVEVGKGTPVNKGKAKATELDLDEGGDVQDADDADVEGDREGDGDPDTDTDSDYPTSHAHDTGAPPSIASRAHPHSELTGVASDVEDEAESEAWSSPVFAHTDSSDVAGSDGEASDVGGGATGKGADAYRYGYRYGYRYESAEAARWGVAASEGTDVGHEAESVHEEEDRLEKEKANLERRKEKERARKVEEEKEREKEKAEWIVLDMGDDTAFSSFLRILHRHLTPPMASSFITSSPIFASPTPISTPTPTPTPTPFPSPISPRASGSSSLHFHWTGLSTSDNDVNEESSYPPSTSHIRHSAEHLSPISTSSNSDRFRFEPPEHPSALAGLSHANVAAPKTFGVLPYPEWRTEVTQRAQRAGMGDVGRAMKWVLWQCGKQLDLDLEEVRNRDGADEKANADIRRKRRETLSLKHRRRSTTSRTSTITRGSKEKAQGGFGVYGDAESASSATVYDSDFSEDTGKLIGVSDSEEESEAEWQGWMADLHRQHQAQAQQKREEEEERMRNEAEALAQAMHESEEEMLVPPKNVEEDRKQVRERRIRYEPSAVVTTMHSGAPTSFSTPSGTLYSASSSESLSRRQRAMSFSPVDRSSSPTGTSSHSHHGHNHSQSTSPLGNNHVIRKHPLPIGASLSHSTSMYATGLRTGANTADPNLRRPSMPIITADQTFSLLQGAVITPHASILRSPITSNFSFPIPSHPPTQSPPFSPGLSSNFPGEDETPRASSSTQATIGPTGPATVPRRASSAGLVSLGGVGGSLGRSSSVLARGGLLKKDATKEADRLREKEKRTKEKEDKAKEKEEKAREKERAKDLEREAKEARKLQRPKLSLATSSTHQLVQQPATSQVRSPTKTETGRSIMRRVKSGSSLNAGAILEEGRPASPTADGGATTQGAKSKRAVFVHRLVRGLDSAMEFAEGK